LLVTTEITTVVKSGCFPSKITYLDLQATGLYVRQTKEESKQRNTKETQKQNNSAVMGVV
jgi:hypothetical protein